jgi:GTP-binding protein
LNSRVEELFQKEVSKAISKSHVVILVLDLSYGITKSDFEILDKITKEGRSLMIVANKWDALSDKNKEKYTKELKSIINTRYSSIKNIPILFVSAKSGLRVDSIMYEVLRLYDKWNTRISTCFLNKWLTEFKRGLKTPHIRGMHLKLKYIMQLKARPPTFYLCVNKNEAIITAFEKHIKNSLSKEFELGGVPIRIIFKDNNPTTREPTTLGSKIIKSKILMKRQDNTNITKMRRQSGSRKLYGKVYTNI